MQPRFLAAALLLAMTAAAQPAADRKDWIQLFNGRNLDGWSPKITGYDLNDNFGKTFRVEDGMMKVSYDAYGDGFKGRFGHIFYKDKFSYYIIAVEYRFTGDQAPQGPAWAIRNNGIMVHCQAPETMGKDQDFPISVEVQLLGGSGSPRTTANMCSPGTEVDRNGKIVPGHCMNSTSKTFDGDQWVRVEAVVKGNESIEHFVNGESVLKYENPRIGGGSVSHFDAKVKVDGTPLTEGYISLQGESAPTEFRKIELLNLAGCMDPKAKNFKSYFVKSAPGDCKF